MKGTSNDDLKVLKMTAGFEGGSSTHKRPPKAYAWGRSCLEDYNQSDAIAPRSLEIPNVTKPDKSKTAIKFLISDRKLL
jgi:hypothetical protein